MSTPHLWLDGVTDPVALRESVTTVGRGPDVDVDLDDPTVSPLHAELVRRGRHVYVADLGLSANGTRVNGKPVGRRVLVDGDVVTFGGARTRIGGLSVAPEDAVDTRLRSTPELTRREVDVLVTLCRPALTQQAFVAPATAQEIAAALFVTEAAVKQHLLRLYAKFKVPQGVNRRARLANEVISVGVVRPGVPDPDLEVSRAG